MEFLRSGCRHTMTSALSGTLVLESSVQTPTKTESLRPEEVRAESGGRWQVFLGKPNPFECVNMFLHDLDHSH